MLDSVTIRLGSLVDLSLESAPVTDSGAVVGAAVGKRGLPCGCTNLPMPLLLEMQSQIR